MPSLCEACANAPIEVTEPCDDANDPYRLCSHCHGRLVALALRPVEWFNLSQRHGWWQFLLHDDFYDEDGTATQPQTPVDLPELFPAPTLDEVARNPESLLDFTITRWHLEADAVASWRAHDPEVILDVLERRFDSVENRGIRSATLGVAAATLNSLASDFVRRAWGMYPDTVDLWPLSEASASCLPVDEGISRVTAALSRMEEGERYRQMTCLSAFHSAAVLDWIERYACSPVGDSWGCVAAASEFDWPRAQKWMAMGRPYSLIALDALSSIARPNTPYLRSYGPRLLQPPASQEFVDVLTAHLERDRAPRVKTVTAFLLKNSGAITKSTQ